MLVRTARPRFDDLLRHLLGRPPPRRVGLPQYLRRRRFCAGWGHGSGRLAADGGKVSNSLRDPSGQQGAGRRIAPPQTSMTILRVLCPCVARDLRLRRVFSPLPINVRLERFWGWEFAPLRGAAGCGSGGRPGRHAYWLGCLPCTGITRLRSTRLGFKLQRYYASFGLPVVICLPCLRGLSGILGRA